MQEYTMVDVYEVKALDYTTAGDASATIKRKLKQLGVDSTILRRVAVASYEAELNYKHQRVYDAITRIGGIDGSLVGEIIPSDRIMAYRNKAQLPIAYDKNGNITVGFFAQRSHRVISVDNCLLHSEAFNPIIDCFTDFANEYKLTPYDEKSHSGLLRHLYMRHAMETDEIMVCIVINGKKLPHENELCERLIAVENRIKTIVIKLM